MLSAKFEVQVNDTTKFVFGAEGPAQFVEVLERADVLEEDRGEYFTSVKVLISEEAASNIQSALESVSLHLNPPVRRRRKSTK